MKARLFALVIAAVWIGGLELRAQFIWSGAGANSDVQTPANWEGGVAPTGSGTEDFLFAYTGIYTPTFSVPFGVRNITFSAPVSVYNFVGSGLVTLSGDVTTNPESFSVLSMAAPLALAVGTHNFNLGAVEGFGSDLKLLGPISGSGNIAKYGMNSLIFDHAGNTFSGYVDLLEGTIKVHGDGALGTGLIKMNGGTLIAIDSYSDSLTTILGNDFSLSATSKFGQYGTKGSLTITGTTTIQSGVAMANLQVFGNGLLTFGNVGEASAGSGLWIVGDGLVRMAGTNTYTGGTAVQSGAALILSEAPPSTGLLVAFDDSYIGSEVATNVQAGFINQFNSGSTAGIIGFDTPNLNNPLAITEPLDLTDFNAAARLGTATAAIFQGTITPQGMTYQFGGRGTLTVFSAINGPDSGLTASAGLHLLLNGTNTYGGTTTAQTGAAIVFGGPNAIPASANFESDPSGYIGYTESTGLTADAFLVKFSLTTAYGVIGFDAANPLVGRTVSDAISVSDFSNPVFIGSSTNATLTGTISPKGTTYRFTGFRDGHLTVGSVLSGARDVVVGLDQSLIYSLRPTGVTFAPSVTLSAANTYTGGTVLQSGLLILGHASALGTGPFAAHPLATSGGLATSVANLTIANPIDIGNVFGFTVGGANSFTLTGSLTGGSYTSLDKIDTNTVTLGGNNSGLTGKINIRSGTLEFTSYNSAGNGTLQLWNYDGVYDGQAIINSASTVVFGLVGEDRTKVNLAAGNLVVNQSADTSFDGQLVGPGALVKLGTGTLTLTGASLNSGGTEVNGGTLSVNRGSLTHSSGDVTVGFQNGDNGVLNIADGGTVSNVNANVGQYPGGTGIVIVAGAGSAWHNSNNLSVGLHGTGTMNLSAGGAVTSLAGYVGLDGTGTVTVSGAGSKWSTTDVMMIGGNSSAGNGVLSVIGGGVIDAGYGSIGDNGIGDVIIDGSGSTWQSGGPLTIGSNSGTGYFTVQNGGTVTGSYGEIGLNFGTGTATLMDPGSNWTVVSSLGIGNYGGTGLLQVLNLAKLTINGGTGTLSLGVGSEGHGTLIIGDTALEPYGGIINAASITSGGGTGQVKFDTSMTRTTPYFLTKDGTAGGSPVLITGTLAVFNEHGYTVLNGANTYSGGTTISGGTLVAGSNSALGTGTILLSGGNLSLASGVVLTNPLDLTAGGILGGHGTFGGPVTVGPGVALTPGHSVGLLTFSGGTTWGPGGTYGVEIQSAAGARGVGYDSIDVTGGLTFNATLGSPFTINLISLDVSGAPGAVSDFNSGTGYAWVIAHTDTLTGFNPAYVTISTSSFTNSIGIGGFNVSAVGNDVYLNFSPVPEPATYALLGLGLGAGLLWFRRRRLM